MSDLIDKSVLMEKMHKYGFTAPDMTVHEFVEDELITVAAPRWVRCEDELPPNDGKEVLVTDGFHVGIGICGYKWSKTRKWTQEAVWYKWNLNDYGYPMKKFKADTHIKAWMPLPEPPKEGV